MYNTILNTLFSYQASQNDVVQKVNFLHYIKITITSH